MEACGNVAGKAAELVKKGDAKKTCRAGLRGQSLRPTFFRGKKGKIQRSSVVERSAVNRLVVGSSPTAGANLQDAHCECQRTVKVYHAGSNQNVPP